MTSTRPELADRATAVTAQGACLTMGMCLVAGLLILLGTGCKTDGGTSSLPWDRTQSWELNNGGVPFPWDPRGR